MQYRLGVPSLDFVQNSNQETDGGALRQGAGRPEDARGLYAERKREVVFLAPNVFRTTFFLPSDIPTGEYRVSVYLFRGEAFLAGETQTLTIEKGGFSERITRAALDLPFPYGLACVVLAIFTGWLAGLVFRRP